MNHPIIRTILWTAVQVPKRIAAVFLSLSLVMVGSNAGELTIYSTTDADNLKVFGEAFNKAHPDIKVNWVRDSTGIMHARLMAEKDNPRADVLFAMAATSMLGMDELGMFLPYTPKGVGCAGCAVPRQERSGALDGNLRLGRCDLLQHR